MRMFALPLVLASLLAASPALSQDAARGAVLYTDFCAVCHGLALEGDGPMAEALTVAPPDLTRLGAGEAFPIVDVARQIDGRRRPLAHGGEMPLFGNWFEGEGADVAMQGPGGQPILLSRPIADLIAFLMEAQS